MYLLKCTQAAQKAIGLRRASRVEDVACTAPLGNWYVNRIELDGTGAFLFMSETTLLSFVLYQGKKAVTTETLPVMHLMGLAQLLDFLGIDRQTIERVVDLHDRGFYAKTDNRSTLGSMNDLAATYQFIVDREGGLDACDLTSIILQLNSMPQRTLGWRTSREALQASLAGI